MVLSLPRSLEGYEAESESFTNADFDCAVVEAQGRRPTQEDAYGFGCTDQWADFWVLDGHRGTEAAHFGVAALRREIGETIKGGKLPTGAKISQAFRSVDNQLRKHFKQNPAEKNSGSTVIGALVARQKNGNYSAKLVNCGDSRGIIITKPDDGDGLEVVQTIDHKPGNTKEKARILAAGGKVKGGGCARIDGKLAVSRGLGDFDFKSDRGRKAHEQKVSNEPEIVEASELAPGSLLLLACDGVWGVMSSKEVAAKVLELLSTDPARDLEDVAAEVVRLSLELGSKDNLTVLLVHLVGGLPRPPPGPGSASIATVEIEEDGAPT